MAVHVWPWPEGRLPCTETHRDSAQEKGKDDEGMDGWMQGDL